jgi:hypothetical protein
MGKRQATRYTQMGITSKKTKARDTYSAISKFYPVTLLLTIYQLIKTRETEELTNYLNN